MNPNMGAFKPDWREAQERMTAWWTGRPIDRVPAAIHAPVAPESPRTASYICKVPEKYTDPGTVFNNLEYGLERRFFGAEAFPSHFVYCGPMFCLAFLGCDPHFTADTTWYDPAFNSVDELANLRLDPANRWLQLFKRLTQMSLDRSGGRYLTHNNFNLLALMDVICGLLGNEPALAALLDRPGAIKAALQRMAPWIKRLCDEGYDLFKGRQEGGIDWMDVWVPGRVVSSQCDMSVMISPDMFAEFVVPDLTASYSAVDYGIYHMDGPEQIRHLDLLLGIDSLHLIQWMPGSKMANPGFGDPLNWIDLFKRIQAGGKKVLIYCPPEQIRPLLDRISRDQVFLSVSCPDLPCAQAALRELARIGTR